MIDDRSIVYAARFMNNTNEASPTFRCSDSSLEAAAEPGHISLVFMWLWLSFKTQVLVASLYLPISADAGMRHQYDRYEALLDYYSKREKLVHIPSI